MCACVYMCLCVEVCVCMCMCPCVCRSEVGVAVSFHYALLYLTRQGLLLKDEAFQSSKPACLEDPISNHGALQTCCHVQTTLTWTLVPRFRPSHLSSKCTTQKSHLPNSQRSFYVITISGEGACLSWHMCGCQWTTSWGRIPSSTINGLWGPNSGHQAGPASHRPISKTVLKNFMQSWAFWKSQYWDSGMCIGNVQSRPANGVYRYVQGMDWEPFPSQG